MPRHTKCLSRIATTQSRRIQGRWLPARCYATSTADDPPWFQQLRSEMLGRDIISSREYIDENIDHRLTDTLCTFLPPSWCRRIRGDGRVVPVGHHLVWFNASMPVDQLLPDGTDPLQSPGEPWVRRMWAGGSVRISPEAYYDQGTGFATDSSVVCAEHIADVQLRGNGDAAKIFVTIERRFARHDSLLEKHVAPLRGIQSASKRSLSPQWHFREQLRSKAWGDAILIEQRNLVFLKDKTTAELDAIKAGNMVPVKYLKPPGKPDFSHTLVPTRALLFRYSALTFNAHLIHLDREYARDIEGHRNLLVHGPLSLTLMLQAMSGYIEANTASSHILESIEYRNLAPLYCDEEMRICGMEKENLPSQSMVFDVWIEGPTGGVAVKGTVRTVRKSIIGSQQGAPIPNMTCSPSHSQDAEDNFKEHALESKSRFNISGAKVKANQASRSILGIPWKQGTVSASPVPSTFRTPTSPVPDSISKNRRNRKSAKAGAAQTTRSAQKGRKRNIASLSEFTLPSVSQLGRAASPSLTESDLTTSSVQDVPSTDPRPRRAYRRNRSERATSSHVQSDSDTSSTIRRVLAPPSPMKRTQSLRTRILLRRTARLRPLGYTFKPVPLVRKYRGKQYTYNASKVANRHSRFKREGVRAIQSPHFVKTRSAVNRLVSR